MEGGLGHPTASVCPVCLQRVPAERLRVNGAVYLRRTCREHGDFQSIVWRGQADIDGWLEGTERAAGGNPACPTGCGLCPEHLQDTCCTLLEVTHRCNLACRYCFADDRTAAEPSLLQIESWLLQLIRPGGTLVQLSGGEPTLRDDLPQIVAAAKRLGCRHVQLNSNGLRLAEEPGYVQALAAAGLSFVFMQFDGTEEAIHRQLRGRPLLEIKKRAIAHCAAQHIGVTLVPTLVPGVNTGNIGEILRFAVAHSPAVRGVHFQPVSFFGRIPARPTDEMRFTLDELLVALEAQTGGMVEAKDLLPSRCDHPLCGFHGDFLVAPGGRLVSLSRRGQDRAGCCGGGADTAERNRAFVARRWQRPPEDDAGPGGGDLRDLETFLRRVRSHGFTVTAMAFQDAGNLDLERLRRCGLHVFDQGRFVPFCAHYLSGWRP